MTTKHLFPAALLACATLFSATCLASGSTSSASSAGSQSSGSLSDSIQGSSNSSSPNNNVADGDYRITDVADAATPGRVRLTLEPVAEGATGFVLELPVAATAPHGLATGELVRAKTRPYGIEFARTETREPFFLVLADAWHHELSSRPVAL